MKQFKKVQKNRKRNFKRILITIIALSLLVVCIHLLILGFQKSKNNYEFYDVNDNYGTSSNCQIKNDTLICEVNGNDVPVKQFSKTE